jgi:hypothetical protein
VSFASIERVVVAVGSSSTRSKRPQASAAIVIQSLLNAHPFKTMDGPPFVQAVHRLLPAQAPGRFTNT